MQVHSGGGASSSSETVIYEIESATFDTASCDDYDYDTFLKSYIKFVSDLDVEDGDTIAVTGTVNLNKTGDYAFFLLGTTNANGNSDSLFIEKTFEDDCSSLELNETFTWSNPMSESFFGFGVRQKKESGVTDGYTITNFKIAKITS